MNWRPQSPADENHIRHCSILYRRTKQRLQQASVSFTPVDSLWGYLIAGTVNPRTGSPFHSTLEAMDHLSILKSA